MNIDADGLVYRAAFSVQTRGYIGYKDGKPSTFAGKKKDIEEEVDELVSYAAVDEDDVQEAIYNFNSMLRGILNKFNTQVYKLFLTGKGNYRNDIYAQYKEGRAPRPILYEVVRQYAEADQYSVVSEGEEADDMLGYSQSHDTVICSIDKDLLMIPGYHYNYVTGKVQEIDRATAIRNFYTQLLTGDNVDNIPGLQGIGPAKAKKALQDCETEEDMYQVVLNMYDQDKDTVLRNGRLLWIRRKPEELWSPPC